MRRIGTLRPCGQVTDFASRSMTKRSLEKPPVVFEGLDEFRHGVSVRGVRRGEERLVDEL
jgi:hypothetical protein